MRDPRSILITGASSGIGEALALEYAAPGVTLALSGRDPIRTEAVAEACRQRGATATGRVIDVADRAAMAAWIAECHQAAPLDLVIANAGISPSTGYAGGEPEDRVREIFAVNIDGVVNTVMPALTAMRAKAPAGGVRGQIAIVSSLAGFRGIAGAPAYSASKAAVKSWGEALRGLHHAEGIRISVICPGFVESRMTEGNEFPQPFKMSAARAARIIRRGLARNRGRIAFPWPMYIASWHAGALPDWLTHAIVRRLPKKDQ